MKDRIYDPRNPNLYGYVFCKPESLLIRLCWWLYGRNRIVAWYLHREQSALGRIRNWAANRILQYLYTK